MGPKASNKAANHEIYMAARMFEQSHGIIQYPKTPIKQLRNHLNNFTAIFTNVRKPWRRQSTIKYSHKNVWTFYGQFYNSSNTSLMATLIK